MDLNVPLVLSCELIGGGRLIRRPDEASARAGRLRTRLAVDAE